jgi:hypothetical protein
MESEGSLPCSQRPTTGPYPKPNESSPQLPTLRTILILSSRILPSLSVRLLSSVFPIKCLYLFTNLLFNVAT